MEQILYSSMLSISSRRSLDPDSAANQIICHSLTEISCGRPQKNSKELTIQSHIISECATLDSLTTRPPDSASSALARIRAPLNFNRRNAKVAVTCGSKLKICLHLWSGLSLTSCAWILNKFTMTKTGKRLQSIQNKTRARKLNKRIAQIPQNLYQKQCTSKKRQLKRRASSWSGHLFL